MAYKKSKNVNLDALIQREDFEASDESLNAASKIATLSINDLREGSGLFLASVRKPEKRLIGTQIKLLASSRVL
mgnify:CR=1 FL=1